jgi:hypothetical protein
MHERTRRAVARLLFVLGCAMPTSLTVLMVLVTFTPWYARYRRDCLEQELSRRIGLKVTIEAVEYPAPATVRLTGVKLLEPETDAEVARVYMVTWVTTDDKTAVRLSQPELQSSQLPFAWRVVHDRFLCQPDLTTIPVRIAADDLTLHSRTGPLTLRDVDAWLRPVDSGIEAMLQIVPAGRTDNAPVHISVIRNRSQSIPTTEWTMKTGNLPLPCSAIADYFPAMRKLGPEATFQGTMQWKLARDQWSLDLGGSHIASIDLSELTQGMVNRLTGDASVSLERCRIEPGNQMDLSGKLLAGSGFVSQSLIQSLRSEMDFDVAPAIEGDIRDWPYEQFAIRFDLFGPDMKLEGICEQQRGLEHLPAGTVFTINGSGFCASKPARRSWVGLIRALWPEKGESLPVSTQTAWLFDLLPAPNPTVSHGQDFQYPTPRITSAGELEGTPSISQP